MKNKKKKLLTIAITLITIIIICIILILIKNKPSSKEFTINKDNFTAQIIEYEPYWDDAYDEDDIFIIKKDGDNIHIVDDRQKEYYIIDNELIESIESKRTDDIVWIYAKDKPQDVISLINGLSPTEYVTNRKDLPILIVNELKKSQYDYKDEVFTFKIDETLNDNIINILIESWNDQLINENFVASDCEDGCYSKYKVKNIELETKEANVKQIKIELVNVVYDKDGNILKDWSYSEYDDINIIFRFNNYNSTEVTLSNEIKTSLASTQAGEFVGKYTHTITCPNGESHQETIELTKQFDTMFGMGWEAKYTLYDCECDYDFTEETKYHVENNIISFYEGWDTEPLVQFKYTTTSLIELDKNNTVTNIFIKE